MKRTLLSAVIAMTSLTAAHAQATLTAASNPVAGDVYVGHLLDSNSVAIGASGAAVTWNFASVVDTLTDTTTFMACSATPYCGSFPGSNLASFDGTDYTYFIAGSTKLTAVGGYSSPDTILFSDPKDFMRYPFTYNNMYKDTSAVTLSGGSVIFIDSNSADAYGTLILPSGTFNNVLRVHTTTVSQYLFGGFPVGGDSTETYNWYKPGFHSPLLTISLDTTGGTMHITEAKYYTGPMSTTAVTDVTKITKLNVFPNPASDVVRISFDLQHTTNATVTISDLTGRTISVIAADKLNSGKNEISYSLTELPAGMYIIQLHSAEGNATQKFVVTK